ncbi:hypothetical protein MLD38_034930 [Melastoma candidum]|uniref:Uncharacterized protein n=1 Tax=Melastoma candidum TaxID=119954 RepID=A0ACB9MDV4_9MYRT|nr:hypothetical protein MLD38_034930 [Melastoma candidum]
MESCNSMKRLNSYLKLRRDDVSAGIPGKFLHVVMGEDVFNVGSFVLTILYAYYLHETCRDDEFCTVPVINMKRVELNSQRHQMVDQFVSDRWGISNIHR